MNNSNQVIGSAFISKDKVHTLHEIKDLCFFHTTDERKRFLAQVAQSVGCERIEEIKECDFGTAYLTAKAILHKIGEDVFKPKSRYLGIAAKFEYSDSFAQY